MDLSGNTVLVTGGGGGIGLAIARRFLDAGSRVIVCDLDPEKLAEARAAHPGLVTRAADVADAAGREELVAWTIAEHPDLDVLVNNAAIQRRKRFATDTADWPSRHKEIAINLEAPVHLSALVLDQLRAQPRAAIVNVSAELAFVPALFAPVYAATKARLHSFTMSLRAELEDTPVRVVEILPPAVNTDLGGAGIHAGTTPVGEFVDAVMARVAAGEVEVGYDSSETARRASREWLDERFALYTETIRR